MCDDGVKEKKTTQVHHWVPLLCRIELAVGGVVWLVAHGALGVSQVLALVHREAAGATAEAVALRSELAAVALLAKQLASVLASVGAVQPLVAETTNEAGLVPLAASSQHLLGGIDGLAALGALGMFNGLERHLADLERSARTV